jgi:hypothetical protein
VARRMVVRESLAQGPAELANDNASRRSLDVSRFSGTGDGLKKELRRPLTSTSRRQPPELDFRRFNTHIVSQNVAGLWLKYGVKSAKIEASSRPKNKLHDATIC